jgi:putative hydrolase
MSRSTKINVGRAVDWGFAATVGAKLARPGPAATEYTRRQVIDQLASAALRAEMPVREVTGLNEGGEVSDARIVDRPQWIRAATQSMRVMTGGSENARNGDKPNFITGRITGAQTGAVLAFISSGILGQYDPFGENGGELLLVYPNVIAVWNVSSGYCPPTSALGVCTRSPIVCSSGPTRGWPSTCPTRSRC